MTVDRHKTAHERIPQYLRKAVWAVFALVFGLAVTACSDTDRATNLSEGITSNKVRQYLLEHPELALDDPEIARAISLARSARQGQARALWRKSILAKNASLLDSALTPASGDIGSQVTIIEFYDYQCMPCKASYPELEQIKKTEKDVRIIYAQLPVFGSYSILAARGAIGAHRQGLFQAYHDALMTANIHLDMDSIFVMAAEIGLNTEKLEADMRDPQVIHYLEQMRLLADELDVTGTPAFVVGDSILRGGTEVKKLKLELNRQRTQSHLPSGV
jgi:protein-disulfide isomerase